MVGNKRLQNPPRLKRLAEMAEMADLHAVAKRVVRRGKQRSSESCFLRTPRQPGKEVTHCVPGLLAHPFRAVLGKRWWAGFCAHCFPPLMAGKSALWSGSADLLWIFS